MTMNTMNLEKIPVEEMELIKGGAWVLTQEGWVWIDDDPPTEEDEDLESTCATFK